MIPPWSGLTDLFRRMRRYALLCGTCGHLPDPPTPRAHRISKRLARLLAWIHVGPIEIVGLENLRVPGPKIIAPNHASPADPFVLYPLLTEPARYMTAGIVLRFLGGLGALALGPGGAFCADIEPGQGIPALDAGVRVLTSGQTLVLFIEGWGEWGTANRPFKRGAVVIAREAATRLGHSVPIVPVRFRYRVLPGEWIHRFSWGVQLFLAALAFPVYRRGLQLIVGEPISSSKLPASDRAATAHLRETIFALGPSVRPSP